MRAAANTQAVRSVFRVFNGKEDAVLRGVDTKEDLLTLARVTNRVKTALPARALASNAVVPLRTRGQHQANLGIFEINLNATGADDIDAFKAELLSANNGFVECVAIEKFPLGPGRRSVWW